MRRREFITLVGVSVAMARPLAAGAQQKKAYRIGVLSRTCNRACSRRSATSFTSGAKSKGVTSASSCGMRPDTMSGCPRWRTSF